MRICKDMQIHGRQGCKVSMGKVGLNSVGLHVEVNLPQPGELAHGLVPEVWPSDGLEIYVECERPQEIWAARLMSRCDGF